MGTRNIRLVIAYDGTDFSGWQRQGNGRSVQGEIEQALEKIHHEPVHLIGSGRTDAGVHAIGQVANFHTPLASIPAERFVMALNGLLPQDVRILEAREASPDFHARFDARYRTYRYFFVCGRPALPQELRYAHQLWRIPDIGLLATYCRFLQGELDCSLFASAGDTSVSRHRYILGCRFIQEGSYLVFEITANAFLWKMVRSIVGTLLFYEERGLEPEEFERIVHRGDRKEAGPTVPPQGLFLWHIDYYRN